MHTTTQRSKPKDATGGFVLWIAVYAAFMLGLVAFNGGTDFFSNHGPTTVAQLTGR